MQQAATYHYSNVTPIMMKTEFDRIREQTEPKQAMHPTFSPCLYHNHGILTILAF